MPLSRRRFLAASAALPLSAGLLGSHGAGAFDEAAPQEERLAFYVIGDTHFLADKEHPAEQAHASRQVCAGLVDWLNKLPGMEIPAAAGGGKVGQPRGVIHAGDCIDTGDKSGELHQSMQKTEWARFQEEYGLVGGDGRLKLPVYEVHGNHDAPGGKGLVVEGIQERNRKRPGLVNVATNGLHYSWDWSGVHFVNLGIVVGETKKTDRKRRYAPLASLEFLQDDLSAKVGKSGRPVVLTHHVDMARYATTCGETPPTGNPEWDPCDVHAYYEALAGYNIAAIFYGHTHVRNIYRWDGGTKPAAKGYAVYNVDNSSHFNSETQSFFYCELGGGELVVREFHTDNRWRDAAFTPQAWKTPVAAPA